jgi:hypothetical protein
VQQSTSVGWRIGTSGSSSYGWDNLKGPVARSPSWDHFEGELTVKGYIGPKFSINLKVMDPLHCKFWAGWGSVGRNRSQDAASFIPDLSWSAYVEAQFPALSSKFIGE